MMMMMMVATSGVVLLASLLLCLFNVLWVKPRKVRTKLLANQGIGGPPPANFIVGNIPQITHMKKQQLQHHHHHHLSSSSSTPTTSSQISHAWTSSLFPFLHHCITQYGPIFLYSTGSLQLLSITDVELVKELGLHMSLDLGKPSYLSKDRGPLLGQGILSSSGRLWAHQRKIIAPEFYIDRVKNMVHMMAEATGMLISSWEANIIENKGGGIAEMRVDESMRCLSADIISKACFGSSYYRGEQIFSKLRTLQKVMSMRNIGIPLSRHLPTRNNRQIWRLESEIKRMILEVVRERMEARSEKDLLQMILEGAESLKDFDGVPNDFSKEKFIVDNCKNIYFAGHETTAVTTSWTLLLLAAHPEWQARARAEVLESCKNGSLDASSIRSLKTLTMVIQETLRLYPPAGFVVREASEDMKFKAIQIPKGVVLQIPISILHHSPELWGPDAHEFNPERFTDGVVMACKVPQAYMPFGLGPHTCAGQHFAMAEMKVILAMLLSKFHFSVSPAYRHSPAFRLVIEPENGIPLLVSPFNSSIGTSTEG